MLRTWGKVLDLLPWHLSGSLILLQLPYPGETPALQSRATPDQDRTSDPGCTPSYLPNGSDTLWEVLPAQGSTRPAILMTVHVWDLASSCGKGQEGGSPILSRLLLSKMPT